MIREIGLYLAWLVTLVATGGSLYFSEVAGFVPCTLCWYQRILMYPQTIVLGIGAYRRDTDLVVYLLPVNLLGMGIALFHYLEQKVPGFGAPAVCRQGVPCSVEYINWLGFITIPLLSLTAFTLVALLLIGLWRSREVRSDPAAGYTA
ncbi:MAG TPA: disulfide oxidoreductase [Trueperaceae bacterium]